MNWPFVISQPRTRSSAVTSMSWTGHQRFCLIGVRHSRCSIRNCTSDCRAAGAVAGASPTGMLTSPKLIDPFQVVRMREVYGEGGTCSRPAIAFLRARASADAACADVRRRIRARVEVRPLDDVARARRVDELAAAAVDPFVPPAVAAADGA